MAQGKMSRLREIAGILVKYGFRDLIDQMKLDKEVTRTSENEEGDIKTVPKSRWKRIRLAFEELGTTYIKLGQMMSNRSDIFPEELIYELEKLQDEVPTFDTVEARAILEDELKKPLNEIFDFFDNIPLASASISQVYKAKLIHGQHWVAVKVQRPDLKEKIDIDLSILKESANIFKKYIPEVKQFNIYDFLKEFEVSLNKELNFKTETNNILKFRQKVEKQPFLHVPYVHLDYCTKRVITMEYLEGVKINDIETLQHPPYNAKLIASRYLDLYFDQIFEYGIFHADPHPGNIMVYPDNTLAFIDFGIVGLVHKRDRELLTAIILGVEEKDAKRILRAFQKISPTPLDNRVELEYQLNELIEDISFQEISDIDVNEMGTRIRSLVMQYNIQIPSNFFLLSKAISIVEGTVKQLNPELRIEREVKPHAKKILLQRLNPVSIIKSMLISSVDLTSVIRELPSDFEEIIKKIKEGTININLEHRGIDNLIHTFNKVVNRVVLSLLQASLLIASALIILARIPPHWNEISVIGLGGFIISGILALILIYRILRDREW